MLKIRKRTRSRILVAVLFLIVLFAGFGCSGGGGSNDEDAPPPPPPSGSGFIEWIGSANGEWVADVSPDFFRFEVDTGYMHFGSTTYTNTYVDASANLIWNSTIIAGVYYVESTSGDTVTALIGNNGCFIDIYGPESNLTWQQTSTLPVFASAGASDSASASDSVGNIEAYSARYYQESIHPGAEMEEDGSSDDSPVETRMQDGEALFLPLLSPENPEIGEPNAFVEQNEEAQEGILY